MKEKQKKILIQDLCARLPYGVKVQIDVNYCSIHGVFTLNRIDLSRKRDPFWVIDAKAFRGYSFKEFGFYYSEIKPYLRPLSSMTEEEKNDLKEDGIKLDVCSDSKYIAYQWHGSMWEQDPLENEDTNFLYHWFYKHFFDINGLIPKGLAIEAPKDMYKFE